MGFQGRTWPRLAALAVLVACAVPTSAGARRDDLQIELSKPAPGATVADATRGLAVDFTCPVYHPFVEDSVVTAPGDDYFVMLADKPDVDEHGMLLEANRVDLRPAVVLEPAKAPADAPPAPLHCTAAEDDAGRGLLPREPGRYWWQAYRTCHSVVLCRGAPAEISDVAAVTVTRTVCTVQRAALAKAQSRLAAARKQLKRRATKARRARVARLDDRVAQLRARVRVVLDCRRT